jgi:hypothetical protein
MEPLDTCPKSWRALCVGTCTECHRAMAPKRRMEAEPRLSRWYVRAMNRETGICCSCHWRLHTDKTGHKKRRKEPRVYKEPLTEQRVRELRAMVGACMECGWAFDTDGWFHTSQGCSTGVVVARLEAAMCAIDELAAEDGMRDTA